MNFKVYKSSAGSGKTFTLVKEYLGLVLSDNQEPPQKYKHILAITFTNKAANEMKERIMKALLELSEGRNTMLLEMLISEIKLDELTIKKRAGTVLKIILHNYSDFGVGTIDSFIHRIIRTFAYDLQLPINFEIEMDAELLLNQSIDILISRAGIDENLTNVLTAFVEDKTDSEKSWNIEHDLYKLSKQLISEESGEKIEQLENISLIDFLKIKKHIDTLVNDFETQITAIAKEAFTTITNTGLDETSFFQAKSGIGGYFKKIANGNIEGIEPNSFVQKTIHENNWYSKKTAADIASKIESIRDKLTAYFNQLEKLRLEKHSNYIIYKNISKNLYALSLLNELKKTITEIKKENNILHISEFNKLIAKIVMNEPAPFIYERIGEKYNNYLIDEFQDTSIMQFNNLLPLLENSLATGNFNMLVGDGKQAIYRWRGGKVEQFVQLPNIDANNAVAKEREQAFKRNYAEAHLSKNFRSKAEIIQFNNDFYSYLKTQLHKTDELIYEKHEQLFNKENAGGYINISFKPSKEDDDDFFNTSSTLNQINTAINNGYQLRDIAILCRKNKHGNVIANFLVNNNIPVISPDSLLLKNIPEINFIESLLAYIVNPEDSIANVNILYHLSRNKIITDELSAIIEQSKTTRLEKILKQKNIHFNLVFLKQKSLYELVETLIKTFEMDKQSNAVLFFLDEVMRFSKKNNNNLNKFNEWWQVQREKVSLKIPDQTNAVNIMTIHRSKGLEFPVVIVPYAAWETKSSVDHLWIDNIPDLASELPAAIINSNKELEKTIYKDLYSAEQQKSLLDNINLLYVATTRAVDQLYIISGEIPKESENINRLNQLIAGYLQNKGSLSDSQLCYEFGASTRNTKQTTKTDNSKRSIPYSKINIHEILRIRTNASNIWELDAQTNSKNNGVLIHAILADILHQEDIEPALNKAINEGFIDASEKINLKAKLERIINKKELQELYVKGNEVLNEREIILNKTEAIRPDRVVIRNGILFIIDYKTGVEKKQHQEQLNHYAFAFKKMGYSTIKKLLVYTEDEKVVTVD